MRVSSLARKQCHTCITHKQMYVCIHVHINKCMYVYTYTGGGNQCTCAPVCAYQVWQGNNALPYKHQTIHKLMYVCIYVRMFYTYTQMEREHALVHLFARIKSRKKTLPRILLRCFERPWVEILQQRYVCMYVCMHSYY